MAAYRFQLQPSDVWLDALVADAVSMEAAPDGDILQSHEFTLSTRIGTLNLWFNRERKAGPNDYYVGCYLERDHDEHRAATTGKGPGAMLAKGVLGKLAARKPAPPPPEDDEDDSEDADDDGDAASGDADDVTGDAAGDAAAAAAAPASPRSPASSRSPASPRAGAVALKASGQDLCYAIVVRAIKGDETRELGSVGGKVPADAWASGDGWGSPKMFTWGDLRRAVLEGFSVCATAVAQSCKMHGRGRAARERPARLQRRRCARRAERAIHRRGGGGEGRRLQGAPAGAGVRQPSARQHAARDGARGDARGGDRAGGR